MFWVRYDIIRKYFTNEIIDFILKITPKGYLNEPSINHSIERIFGYIIKNEGKLIEVI
jgi:lipopolysaccharide biosynthesis protein